MNLAANPRVKLYRCREGPKAGSGYNKHLSTDTATEALFPPKPGLKEYGKQSPLNS